ncbi:hypothetical protein QBC47DRAFT_99712 [Echria macrotheca]|uniref:Rhodopsin domain-containing protein n=1 Tax=Echria macrotheca TaxID=438768 RepID=A0AAJ0FEW0_9PEZI|nr:hypothetical protein QBC47DRAFT_99712 [Echria macrotheca]
MADSSTDGGPPGPDPSTGLYPGQSAPLATLTATDQSGAVIIGAALALVFALIAMFIRLYVRLQFQRGFSMDDMLAATSMAFFILQSGLVFGEVHQGFGKTIDDVSPAGLVAIQKIGYVADIFYLLTTLLTKGSIGYLFIRLSPDINHIRAAYGCLAAATVFTVASILATCLRCDLQAPWIFINAQCTGLLTRWQAIAALDIISEVGLFAVAIHMTQGLRVSVSSKLVVLFAFGLRLIILVPILIRLKYLGDSISSSNWTLDGVLTVLCTQIHISYAIIATTTPCLRPFMAALSTNYGGPTETKTPSGTKLSASKLSKMTGNSDRSKRSAAQKSEVGYALEDMTVTEPERDIEARHSAVPQEDPGAKVPTTRWDGADYRVAIMSRNLSGDARSTQSNDSQKMIISKNTEWQVEYLGDGHESTGSRHS